MAAQQTHAQARAAAAASSPVPPTTTAITGQGTASRASTHDLRAVANTRHVELPEDFAQALRGFSDLTQQIATRTHRAGAVLRLMQAHCMEGKATEEGDMIELINLIAETLPHHYDDVNDPLDEFETTAREAVRGAIDYSDTLSEILDAMTIVASGDATLQDLEDAAGKVYKIACAEPAFEPDWQRLTDVITSRGFLVEIEVIKDFDLGPRVTTPEIAKHERKLKRAAHDLHAQGRKIDDAKRTMQGAKA